jgi:agmatinase
MLKILGIPFDANSSFLRGASLAPARIRLMDREGSANRFSESGLEVVPGSTYADMGDLSFPDASPERTFQLIKNKVAGLLNPNDRLICLGGDHSVSWPIIDAYCAIHSELHILQLDAHSDLYDNFDDNPYSHASPFARIMESGKVKSLTQAGIRTLTTHQREQALRFGVRIIEMKNDGASWIQGLQGPLYVSLDLDVLDPAFAPGVSHHEPGGMSSRQLINIIHDIPVEIVGADIVEYNPVRDFHDITAMVAYRLLRELVAKMH